MIFKNSIRQTIPQANGPDIHIQAGGLAGQADGQVLVSCGNTMILATAVEGEESDTVSNLPLRVDYEEKFYAAGKIPGGFLKREGRPSDHEILTSRLVDRAIRPCFPKGYNKDVQITLWLISSDQNIAPEELVILAASAALATSPIPFQETVSAVRVARIAGKSYINPPKDTLQEADIDLIVAASKSGIVMLEGKMKEIGVEELVASIEHGYQTIEKQCSLQEELASKLDIEKNPYQAPKIDPLAEKKFFDLFYEPCYQIAKHAIKEKKIRNQAFEKIKKGYLMNIPEDEKLHAEVERCFYDITKKAIIDLLLKEGQRIDGRNADQIRHLDMHIDCLPAAHGSALFTRGETQSLTTVTLGSKLDEQLLDGVTLSGYNKVMLHYNFPAFSTGEIRPKRGPGRRETGHAALALNGLQAVMPDNYPLTLRIVSEILASNGSSSMATASCASLALADAGVPIKRLVAGIAMGRMSSENNQSTVLSDISGEEDFFGDMDFKVTGTEEGLTACQLDIKIAQIPIPEIKKILLQAEKGYLYILEQMKLVIDKPKPTHKPHAPSIHTIKIEKAMIGALIGPGGKMIKDIQESTNTTLDIVEKGEHGIVTIFASNEKAVKLAIQRVEAVTAVPTVGNIYMGKVKGIKEFGAFVEFMPGKDGLLHISEISEEKIESVEDIFTIGQEIKVKLINIHPKTGKFGLSSKQLQN